MSTDASPRTPGRARAPAFGVGENAAGESTQPDTPRGPKSTARRFVRAGTDASRRLQKALTGSRRGGGGGEPRRAAPAPPPPKPAPTDPGAAAAAAAASVGGGELGARLARFARGARAGLAGLSEKGVDAARRELAALDAALGGELTRAAVDGHEAFVEAAAGVASLATELDALRSALADRSALEDELLSLARGGSTAADAPSPATPPPLADTPPLDTDAAADIEWGDALDGVDDALAARRPAPALARLRAAERAALARGGGGNTAAAARALAGRRTQLAAVTSDIIHSAVRTAHGVAPSAAAAAARWSSADPPLPDLKSAAAVLAALAGRPHAVDVLLAAHRAALEAEWEGLLTPAATAAAPPDPHGADLAAAVAQAAAIAVASAAADVDATAGGASSGGGAINDAAASALLAAWADDTASAAALVIKRHALAPLAAPAGPARVAAAVAAALGAAAVPTQSGAPSKTPTPTPLPDPRPRLALDLWPALDQVLAASADRAGAALRKAAAGDAARGGGLPPGTSADDSAALAARFPSARALLTDAADAAAALAPVPGPRAAAAALTTAAALYGAWCDGAADAAKNGAPRAAVDAAAAAARALAAKHVPDVLAAAGARDGDGVLLARLEAARKELA